MNNGLMVKLLVVELALIVPGVLIAAGVLKLGAGMDGLVATVLLIAAFTIPMIWPIAKEES